MSGDAYSRSIEVQSLRMLMDRNSTTNYTHVLVAILVGAVIAPAVPIWRCIFFSIGLSFPVLLQLGLSRRVAKTGWQEQHILEAQKEFDALALWVGAMWGFAGLFLFPSGDSARQLFLTFVMGGMSLSAVATQGMRLRTCYTSILPGMVPLGLRYIWEGDTANTLSGVLVLLFVVVQVSLARKINDFMLQAIRLQMEKETLLDDVQRQADDLEIARTDAEEANLSKSRFLAQASHDLRQPLHAISLYVETLPDAESAEEHDEIMGRIRQSLDVLTKLFDSLLDVTLLDTGGIQPKRKNFNPTQLFKELKADFKMVADACNVQLRYAPTNRTLHGDPVLVRRMLQNLLSNAIRHSEGRDVLMGCRNRNGAVAIQVCDTGKGIPASQQSRIFDEFARLDRSRMGDTAKPGLGLGLSIVRRVADELGLSVTLQSEPGRGSIFSIEGFQTAAAGETADLPKEPAAKGNIQAANVVVLDDDPATLAATELLLNRWGCAVDALLTPEGLTELDPDVIICDFELAPELTGLDVLDSLKGTAIADIPAIIISGHTSKEMQAAIAARGIPLLHKPIRPAQLRSALLNALSLSDKAARAGN